MASVMSLSRKDLRKIREFEVIDETGLDAIGVRRVDGFNL